MSLHKQFEIMCALAAVGQLGASDLAELSEHIEACADCQRRLSEFAQVSAQALMPLGEKYGNNPRHPAGMTARFVKRARAEGIPLQKSAGAQPRDFLYSLGWRQNIAAALLILAVIAGISNRRHSPQFSTSATVAGANATGEVTLEPKSRQVRSSRLLKFTQVTQRAKDHRRFETSGGIVKGVQLPDLEFTTPVLLAPSSARYSANCIQGELKLDSFLFSQVADAKEPRLFAAFAGAQQPSRVAPWLISLNSLPPLFLYTADRSSLRSSPVGVSQPSVDFSKIRLEVFSELSGSKRLPLYQEVREQRWPISNEFKVDAR